MLTPPQKRSIACCLYLKCSAPQLRETGHEALELIPSTGQEGVKVKLGSSWSVLSLWSGFISSALANSCPQFQPHIPQALLLPHTAWVLPPATSDRGIENPGSQVVELVRPKLQQRCREDFEYFIIFQQLFNCLHCEYCQALWQYRNGRNTPMSSQNLHSNGQRETGNGMDPLMCTKELCAQWKKQEEGKGMRTGQTKASKGFAPFQMRKWKSLREIE